MQTEPDPHGKLVWEVVALKLATQAASQAALVGRAKDLLGFTTIAITITGLILSDRLAPPVEAEPPVEWLMVAGFALALVYVSGLWAMCPRKYSFAPDPEAFAKAEHDNRSATQAQLYRSLAEGWLEGGTSSIAKNEQHLRHLATAVTIEMVGLTLLGVLAFMLAFVVNVEAPTP